MGQTISTGSATINGTVTQTPALDAPNSNQTFVLITGTGDGNVNTIRTVTTSKSFYLLGMNLTQTAAGDFHEMYANDGTTRYQATVSVTSGYSFPVASAAPMAIWTSGQAVKNKCTNTRTFIVWGFEQ